MNELSKPTSRRKKELDGKKARSKRRYHQRRAEGKSKEEAKKSIHENPSKQPWLDPWKFKPGHAPLPGAGRPRKLPITERLAWAAELPLPEEIAEKYGMPKGASIADLAAYRALVRACEGKDRDATTILTEVRDSLEGKPLTRTAEPSGDSVVPPALNVSFVKGKK